MKLKSILETIVIKLKVNVKKRLHLLKTLYHWQWQKLIKKVAGMRVFCDPFFDVQGQNLQFSNYMNIFKQLLKYFFQC